MFSRVLTCNSTKFKKKKAKFPLLSFTWGGGKGQNFPEEKLFLLAEHHTDTRMRTCLAYYIEEK